MVGIQISFTSQIKKNDVKLSFNKVYIKIFTEWHFNRERKVMTSHWYQQTKRNRSTRSALWLNVVPTVTLADQCSVPVSLCFPSILWCVVIILVTVCVTALPGCSRSKQLQKVVASPTSRHAWGMIVLIHV